MNHIAIISALDRELAPLVRGWPVERVPVQDREVHLYRKDDVLVACAGIGGISARAAADAAWKKSNCEIGLFVSAGLAGALQPELRVADIVQPAKVVDAIDGQEISTIQGEGTLVTAGAIADAGTKAQLAKQHIARAVDMEAYSVADVARVYNVPFIAVKAISDELDFPMPPLGRFVGPKGEFRHGLFSLYVAARPWLIPTVLALGRNSAQATAALCAGLEQIITGFRKGDYNRVNR